MPKYTPDEWADIETSAWLEAEEKTKIYPDQKFRIEFFRQVEELAKDPKSSKYSMDNLMPHPKDMEKE